MHFRLPGSHRLWPIVPDRSTNTPVCNSPALRPDRPYNPDVHARRFGLVRVRSPLLAESLLFSVPAGTEMVHFPALSSATYVFSRRCLGINRGGFPHSEISGSTPVCGSPKLIAAYHVLRRLLAPRHPPYALSSLTLTLEPDAVGAPEPGEPEPEAPGASGPKHTACSLWSEKTTVCRIFGCQRTAPAHRSASATKPSDTAPAATRVSAPAGKAGGEYRARTGDLLVANQALSQLS